MAVTTNRVCGLCNMTPKALSGWIARGVVSPSEPGRRGRGNAHQFDTMTALGVAVAEAVRRSPRGCSSRFVAQVVAAFEGLSEAELLALFDRGLRRFAGLRNGRPVLVAGGEEVDVRRLYSRLIEEG